MIFSHCNLGFDGIQADSGSRELPVFYGLTWCTVFQYVSSYVTDIGPYLDPILMLMRVRKICAAVADAGGPSRPIEG